MKRLILLTLALTTLVASGAQASAGARLTFKPHGPQHTFTIQAARRLAIGLQHRDGLPLRGLRCFWKSVHIAGCEGTWTAVIINSQPAETLSMTDWVTRAGPCSTNVTQRTGPDSGIAHGGGGMPHDCFNGPLVVEVGPTLLR